MDAGYPHHRICLRLGTLGSMIVLLLCFATVTAGNDRDRHGHHRNSRHTSSHRSFGLHSHDHHHDQHGHHFIIHVPRYYFPSYYGLSVYYGQNRFYRNPYFRRPYYCGYGYSYGYSSWPAYNLTGYGGNNGPINTGPINTGPSIGKIVSTQEQNGWELLADGRASLALDAFAQQVRKHPNFSGPIIGYALSVAEAGDLYFGVWELRRALRTNLSSMQAFELQERLRPTVEKLIEDFKAEQKKNSRKDDVSFMLAALHYLLQNPDSAKAAIDQAIREGDRSHSALNLKQSIAQQATKAQAVRVEKQHHQFLQRDLSAQKRGLNTEQKSQRKATASSVNSF